jgi:class 3 adenylate cyclase
MSGANSFDLGLATHSTTSDSAASEAVSTVRSEKEQQEVFVRKETRDIYCLRIGVILVLIGTGLAFSIVAYTSTRNNQTQDFETAFYDQAKRVVDTFQINVRRSVGVIESFSLAITSHAKYTNSTWPNVTFPDFERRGTAAIQLAEVMSVIMVPLVTDETRSEWESYSVENQGWFEDGLEVQEQQQSHQTSRRQMLQNVNVNNAIPEAIYREEGSRATIETGPGPYLPQWQIAPVVPVPYLVNFNLLSRTGYKDSLNALLEAQSAIVGRSFDFSDPNDEETVGRRDVFNLFLAKYQEEGQYDEDPIADIHVPLYDDFNKRSRKLVGLLTCVIYWRTYFVNLLSENADGIVVVLENNCNQKYTYEIRGANASYVGPGDLHDAKYDRLEVVTEESAFLQVDEAARNWEGNCLYSIRVYPSKELEEYYNTNDPLTYATVMALVFVVTSVVFLLYDCLVERRQRVVMDSAAASTAIVSSLFPKSVRERLMHKEEQSLKDKATGNAVEDSPYTTVQQQKENDKYGKSKPIADLFEDCTVLFADISGFTGWSDGREPSDVFYLLETLYGALDKIAKKRKVFKVETIGDCYLAVTGLPEPQEEHAVIMCLFAQECMGKMRRVMDSEEVQETLGESTSKLSMRFGLHSGPVTAGVLRGEKSRFQLFGDTVNTAARMEGTGQRGKIQLSDATADILRTAAKGDWFEERADMVQAKGKGQMQTYWLKLGTQSLVKQGQYKKGNQAIQAMGLMPLATRMSNTGTLGTDFS